MLQGKALTPGGKVRWWRLALRSGTHIESACAGVLMTAADRAAALLPRVARLGDEHGVALQRAYELLSGGALVGPGAGELYEVMAECHRTARRGFYEAFDEVRLLASRTGCGSPRVGMAGIPGPPGGPRASDDIRSGSPDMLERLGHELSRAGGEWREAGGELVRILGSLGLNVGPGQAVRRAGSGVAARRRDVDRRRSELLRQEQSQLVQSAAGIVQGTGQKIAEANAEQSSVLDKAWDAWAHHYMPGLWDGISEIGKQVLATDPATAPFYLVTDPEGWYEQAVTGPANQLLDGLAANPMSAPFYYAFDPSGWSKHGPVRQFKGFVNWDEWKRDPIRAFGHTIPNAVLTALTLGRGMRGMRAGEPLKSAPEKLPGEVSEKGRAKSAPPTKVPESAESPRVKGWVGEDGLRLGPKENAAANRFLEGARANEKSITPEMKRAAAASGGRLEGLRYALKGEDSLKRKVADNYSRQPGATFGDVLKRINDSVRYTFKFPEKSYVDGVRRAANHLKGQGFEPVSWKNTWGKEGYRGINSTWRDPVTGQLFEVQFHTPQSFSAKMVTHELYEKIRLPGTSPEEAARLQREQDEIFGQVPVPAGAPDLGAPK